MQLVKILIYVMAFITLGTITAISVEVEPNDGAIPLEMESLSWGTDAYLFQPDILYETLLIVNTIHDADMLKVLEDLAPVDYSEYFVMALFLGRQSSSDFSITIEQVTREEEHLLIYSNVITPSTGIVDPAISSPYHIVKVRRGDHEWNQDISIDVLFNGTKQLTQTHYLSAPSQMITLERVSGDYGWDPAKLHFELITRWNDIANVEDWISANAVTALQELDYAQQYAAVVFQGAKHSTGYSITVEKMSRRDDEITLQCGMTQAEWDHIRGAGFTSPYHLVQIDRIYEKDREINFVLEVNNGRTLTQTRFISDLVPSTLNGIFYPLENGTGYEAMLENQGDQTAEEVTLSTYTAYGGVSFDIENWSCEEDIDKEHCQRNLGDLIPGQMITTTFSFHALALPFASSAQSCKVRVEFEEPTMTVAANGMAVHLLAGTGESVFDYVAPGITCRGGGVYLPLIMR